MSDTRSLSLGIAYACAAALLFAVMGLAVKLMPMAVPTSELLFCRAVFGLAVLLPTVRSRYRYLFRRKAGAVWLRSAFGACGVGLYFMSLRESSLANATFMADCAPIFVAIIMFILHRRVPAPLEAAGLYCAVAGGYLLRGDGAGLLSPDAMVCGFGSAACAAVAYLALSKAAKEYSAAEIVCCLSIVLALSSLAFADHNWVIPPRSSMLPLAAVAVASVLAQLVTTRAYFRLHPILASALGLTAGLWGCVIDAAFFGHAPTLREGLSYALITAGILAVNMSNLASRKRGIIS